MRILAVDPGYDRIGLAILEKNTNTSPKEQLIYSDCLTTSSQQDFSERLKIIGKKVEKIIKEYKPTALAIESLFFNNNQKTALLVAEVKGAVKYIALSQKLDIFEYTPLQIKTAVTGYGRSTKQQITIMVKNLIEITKEIKLDDEYDAIAVGLTYFAVNPTNNF